MAKPIKIITLEEFNEWKKKYDIKWTMSLPRKQTGVKTSKRILCKCICNKESMVLVRSIQFGHTRMCSSCASIGLDIDGMNSHLVSIGSYWRVENIRTYDKKTDRLKFWSKCTACSKTRLLKHWSELQQGRSKMCFPCSRRFIKIGRFAPFTELEKSVRSIWYRIRRESLKLNLHSEFSDFEAFKRWCFSNAFEVGDRVPRINKALGWGPENCRVLKTEQGKKLRIRSDLSKLAKTPPARVGINSFGSGLI